MNRSLQKLIYEWPPNLTQYEASVFLGLTATEAMVGIMAFILPLTFLENRIGGALLGAALMALTLLSIKKLERLGNVSLPLYLFKRWRAQRQKRQVRLTQIMGIEGATVQIEDERRQTILTIE